jgi:hypothetical protein
VNQVLLERAMEASVGMPVYSDDVLHHVYRRARLPRGRAGGRRPQPASGNAHFSAPVAQSSGGAPPRDGPHYGAAAAAYHRTHRVVWSGECMEGGDGQ